MSTPGSISVGQAIMYKSVQVMTTHMHIETYQGKARLLSPDLNAIDICLF